MINEQEFSKKQIGQIREVVSDGLDAVVAPHLEKIYDKLEDHDKRFGQIDNKLADMQETLDDHSLHLDRIERRQFAQDQRIDRHDLRIKKLETAKIWFLTFSPSLATIISCKLQSLELGMSVW